MNDKHNQTSGDSSPNTQNEDLAFHEVFPHAMRRLWALYRNCITDTSFPAPDITILILKHIDQYTNKYIDGAYLDRNKDILKNQPWNYINDRYGMNSIEGSINELYVMVNLVMQGYTVTPTTDQYRQTVGQQDLEVMKPSWLHPVTCQIKSVLEEDLYGHFTRAKSTFEGWSQTKADRIYISDETHVLWSDVVIFRGTLNDNGILDAPYTTTSLFKLQQMLQKRFPSFENERYGMFEKVY